MPYCDGRTNGQTDCTVRCAVITNNDVLDVNHGLCNNLVGPMTIVSVMDYVDILFPIVLAARCLHKRGLCRRAVSICLSVCSLAVCPSRSCILSKQIDNL